MDRRRTKLQLIATFGNFHFTRMALARNSLSAKTLQDGTYSSRVLNEGVCNKGGGRLQAHFTLINPAVEKKSSRIICLKYSTRQGGPRRLSAVSFFTEQCPSASQIPSSSFLPPVSQIHRLLSLRLSASERASHKRPPVIALKLADSPYRAPTTRYCGGHTCSLACCVKQTLDSSSEEVRRVSKDSHSARFVSQRLNNFSRN